ncbi:MAG TPA: ABC transporter ATP-binding protein [Thermotogota bacterium]|nr:ABC transporter ATP-binding protein [Thermotogota bacterium]HRW33953.1 ABC transporter ATP-binding protein [Thermotogota bacterium]
MQISLENLTKTYNKGSFKAVDQLSLTFEPKKLTVLIGPSGCGKTTVLKMINRLIERTSGDILFDGKSIDQIDPIQLRRQIGYAIQNIGLFIHMNVFDNIAVVPRLLKWPEKKIKSRVEELMELVNLDPQVHMYKYPAQLSGGQKQRIGVARSLAANPKVILMDEPFGAIDPINREKLQDAFIDIQEKIKKTIIFVTHDIREAIKLADKILIMDNGRIVQYDDTVNVVKKPKNAFVDSILGSDRVLKGLEMMPVKDHYSGNFLPINAQEVKTIAMALEYLEKKKKTYAYVIGPRDILLGYCTVEELKRMDQKDELIGQVKPIESVQPHSNLMEAIIRMVESGLTSCPVVDAHHQLLGVIRFETLVEIMSAYERVEV